MSVRKNLTLFFVLALSSAAVMAQPMRGGGRGSGMGPYGGGAGCGGGRFYDVNTVQTFSGTVVSVDRFAMNRGVAARVDLTLQTGQRTLHVILGPDWYIDKLAVMVMKGDAITVKGSLLQETDTLVAAEYTKNGETVVLRDANGIPAWAGGR